MLRLGFASHSPRVQRRNLAVLTAGCAALLTVGVAVPAEAAPIKHEIQKISKASYVTGEVFASCRITTTGGTCTVAKAESITRTVQLSLGVSREVVSAGPLKWRTVDTSATLKAYNPYASDISCGL